MPKMQTVTEKDLRKLIIEMRREERKSIIPVVIEPQVKFYPEFDMKDPGVPINVYVYGGAHRQSPVTAVFK